MATQIWTTLDYDKPGKQLGQLNLPHSVHRSAYGNIVIPMGVVANGKGPTLLLTAGTHGDEYEGQVALTRLLREIEPAAIAGRLIILPMLNAPAARAGLRVSPVDGVNLNRAFPGDPLGSPTQAIAHYVSSVLFPLADIYQDLHAGGSSLDYLPFVSMRASGDADLDAKALAAARAFGAPCIQIWGYSPDPRLTTAESNRQKIISLGGEFGGGGTLSRRGLAIVERGLRRLMSHIGMIAPVDEAPPAPAIEVEVKGRDHYVYATASGLFEPLCDLGEFVEAGQTCGLLHDPEDPLRPAIPHHFAASGLLVCQRHPGQAQRGDCLAHLATPRLATPRRR
jgi:predicted deacylase